MSILLKQLANSRLSSNSGLSTESSSGGLDLPSARLREVERKHPTQMKPLVARLDKAMTKAKSDNHKSYMVLQIMGSWEQTYALMKDDQEVIELFKSDLEYIESHL